ncbi:MAG: hypothetical protein IPJ88_09080 [Myxococcales bacterium]|nr:MAG: hypothetical protein IPJ88_09080 [Myxococcales bacterium]
MSSKKPRDIKDLKARLGRNTSQSPSEAQKGIVKPTLGRSFPSGAPVSSRAALGSLLPPTNDVPRSGRVQAPEFRRKKAQGTAAADPFATASVQPTGPREVRIVVDESAMADSEIGKSRFRMMAIVGGITALVGLVLGYGVGSTSGMNEIYNRTVRDGKDIYAKVQESSKSVLEAQSLVTKAVQKARSDTAVDYDSLQKLQAIKKPFTANEFHRKHYSNFKASTVDDLFDYYNNNNLIWAKIETLAGRTLPQANRKTLDAAAKAAGKIGSTNFGVIVMRQGDGYAAGLTYIATPDGSGDTPKELQVSTRSGGPQYTKTLYSGQSLKENTDNYVIPVEKARSMAILGEPADAFATYSKDLLELGALIEATVETQGRLEKALGDIAKLEERFAF